MTDTSRDSGITDSPFVGNIDPIGRPRGAAGGAGEG